MPSLTYYNNNSNNNNNLSEKIYWNALRFQISSLMHIKMSPNLRDTVKSHYCMTVIQDSLGFWIPRFRVPIPGTAGFRSLSVELGLRIPIINEIPASLSRIRDCRALDFGFQEQKLLGFWNPDSLTCGKKMDWECRHLRTSCHTMSSGYHPLTRNKRPSANEAAITF